MFCKYCGKEVTAGMTYCPQCGRAIEWNGQGTSGYTAPPQQPYGQPQPVYVAPVERKSKLAAGLLGIFLGSLGVHNFYLGYTGKAIAQLLITLLTLGIGSVVSGIWGLIEGILILAGGISVDGKGEPLGV